jgi:hypothetical protein
MLMQESGTVSEGEHYWALIEPYWDRIGMALDSADEFKQTIAAIPREVSLLYAAHFCQSEVCNGGFSQFFGNSAGVLAPEAIDGFKAIGQKRVSGLVRRAISFFGDSYPRERLTRRAAMRNLGSDGNRESKVDGFFRLELFEPLEREFFELLPSEAGGFTVAADRYADRAAGSTDPDSGKG